MGEKKVELEQTFEDGEIIVKEGASGSEMYIIQEGQVAVTREIGDQEMVLATLERGTFFGEMSLLEGLPRSATVRAVGETKLQVLRRGGLLLKIRRDPTFALEMLQQMSYRIRYMSEQLSTLLEAEDLSHEELEGMFVAAEIESLKEDTR
jgi:CRP-like cAMP-binding protein